MEFPSVSTYTCASSMATNSREWGVKMEKAMASYSSTLAWKIPWMEEPGGLQSMGLRRVRHDWVTSLWLFTFMHWRKKWQPTPRDGRAWWAAVFGVAQSQTRLKWLSSSSRGVKRSVYGGFTGYKYKQMTCELWGPLTPTHCFISLLDKIMEGG